MRESLADFVSDAASQSALRCLAAIFLITLLAACTPKVITPDAAVGEWQKLEESLPPINLVLSRDGTRLLARLRLSGVELNGLARLQDNQLYLDFPNREPITGEFTSKVSLELRLEKPNGKFVLTKMR